jgi:hypothetical protein
MLGNNAVKAIILSSVLALVGLLPLHASACMSISINKRWQAHCQLKRLMKIHQKLKSF